MTPKEVTRLAIYALSAVAAAVIAILAYLRGDQSTVAVCLGWIATNVLSSANVNKAPPANHAA